MSVTLDLGDRDKQILRVYWSASQPSWYGKLLIWWHSLSGGRGGRQTDRGRCLPSWSGVHVSAVVCTLTHVHAIYSKIKKRKKKRILFSPSLFFQSLGEQNGLALASPSPPLEGDRFQVLFPLQLTSLSVNHPVWDDAVTPVSTFSSLSCEAVSQDSLTSPAGTFNPVQASIWCGHVIFIILITLQKLFFFLLNTFQESLTRNCQASSYHSFIAASFSCIPKVMEFVCETLYLKLVRGKKFPFWWEVTHLCHTAVCARLNSWQFLLIYSHSPARLPDWKAGVIFE